MILFNQIFLMKIFKLQTIAVKRLPIKISHWITCYMWVMTWSSMTTWETRVWRVTTEKQRTAPLPRNQKVVRWWIDNTVSLSHKLVNEPVIKKIKFNRKHFSLNWPTLTFRFAFYDNKCCPAKYMKYLMTTNVVLRNILNI